jgi:myo-inositol-1(or 4)-monophosphatase
MTDLAPRLEAAIRLATEAGALALRMRPKAGAASITMKGAQDWLTEADGAVEAFLSAALAEEFPMDGFQGEETGKGRQGAMRWVVDPIDGTSNYAHGGSRWCVSLGLIQDRTPVLGVLVAPALGEVFAARVGNGATLNGQPIHAAPTSEAGRAIIEVGWSPRRPNAVFQGIVARLMEAGSMLRAGGSGALGLADVAAGRIDAYIEAHINLWDVAAALAILQEAGAVVSPFMAGDGPEAGNPIVAAAPALASMVFAVADLGPLP